MLDCVFDFPNNQKQPDNEINNPNISRSDVT